MPQLFRIIHGWEAPNVYISNQSRISLKLQVFTKLWAKYQVRVGPGLENARF